MQEWFQAPVTLVLLGAVVGGLFSALFMRMASSRLRQSALRSELEHQHLSADYQTQNQQLTQAQQQVVSLEKQLASLQGHVDAQADRLDEARERADRLEQQWRQAQAEAVQLEKQLVELRVVHQEKLNASAQLMQAFEQAQQRMQTEFQNVANQILEEKGRSFQHHSEQSLDALLRPFREQISSFQQRVNHVHDESVKGQANLGAELRRVLDIGLQMSAEAQNLTSALKGDKKLSGIWGELQLEQTLSLAGLVKGEHFLTQAAFKTDDHQTRYPDFIVKLPDAKHIVIDSKTSLVDYEKAVSAASDVDRLQHLNAHVKAIRRHIDDLAGKRYDQLPGMGSPDFVFMFVPIEAAYVEALKHQPDLFEYGVKRNVMLVSHTSLLPILRTVANLWMIARSNEQAHELGLRAAELHDQVVVVAERLRRMGDVLRQMNAQFGASVTAVAGQQGLYGKIKRFKTLSAKATRDVPELEVVEDDTDFDLQRLDTLLNEASAAPSKAVRHDN